VVERYQDIGGICGLLLQGIFIKENGNSKFIRNVGAYAPDYTASIPRKQ
jgi:hypothetical protein